MHLKAYLFTQSCMWLIPMRIHTEECISLRTFNFQKFTYKTTMPTCDAWPSRAGSRQRACINASAIKFSFNVSISPILRNTTRIYTVTCNVRHAVLLFVYKLQKVFVYFTRRKIDSICIIMNCCRRQQVMTAVESLVHVRWQSSRDAQVKCRCCLFGPDRSTLFSRRPSARFTQGGSKTGLF